MTPHPTLHRNVSFSKNVSWQPMGSGEGAARCPSLKCSLWSGEWEALIYCCLSHCSPQRARVEPPPQDDLDEEWGRTTQALRAKNGELPASVHFSSNPASLRCLVPLRPEPWNRATRHHGVPGERLQVRVSEGPISGPLSCEPSLLWSPLCGKGLLFIPTRESPPLGGASKQLQSQRGPAVSEQSWLPLTPHHPVPRGPNGARPQVLPPQFFTFYYALLESVSHCLGRAARAYPPRS